MIDLASALGAGATGGLFGLIGQVGNRAIGIWEARERRKDMVLTYQQEEKRWGQERALIELQMKARAEETEHELAIAETRGSWAGLAASAEADARAPESYRWVAAVRTLTRPFLTLETQLLLVVLLFVVKDQARVDLLQTVVDTAAFSASTALLWWFGERGQRPRGAK